MTDIPPRALEASISGTPLTRDAEVLRGSRERLTEITLQLRQSLATASYQLVEAGELLLKAKDILPHGKFQAWLRENFQMSSKTANRLMSIAKMVHKLDLAPQLVTELVSLDFNTLCEIAAKSTSAEVQSRVFTKMTQGQTINYELVRLLKHHPEQDPELQQHHKSDFLQFMSVLRQFSLWCDQHLEAVHMPDTQTHAELSLQLESYAQKLRAASELVQAILERNAQDVIHIKAISLDDEQPQ